MADLLTRSLPLYEYFLCFLNRPGHVFATGPKFKIPQKSPQIVNRNRQAVLDGYLDDYNADIRTIHVESELGAIDSHISTLEKQREEKKTEAADKYRSTKIDYRAQLESIKETGVASVAAVDEEIKKMRAQRRRVESTGDLTALHGYAPIEKSAEEQERLEARIDERTNERDLRPPSPPFSGPMDEQLNHIINQRVLPTAAYNSYDRVDDFLEVLAKDNDFSDAFAGMDTQLLELIRLFKNPLLAQLLASGDLYKGLNLALNQPSTTFSSARQFLKLQEKTVGRR